METKFEKIKFNNFKPANATLNSHREIIEGYAEKGYHFTGYIPTKIGPSGKVIEIDLVFEKQ